MKHTYVYLHDGFSDWEGGYLLPLLHSKTPHKVKTVAVASGPVVSMGGLRVLPDLVLADLDPAAAAVFFLPGGESWLDPAANAAVIALLPRLLSAGALLAAICGATLAFARLGFLDDIPHTSNGPGFIEAFVPGYAGARHYRGDAAAVTAGSILTASGIGAVDLAYEFIKALKIYDDRTASEWYGLFKNGVIPPPDFWSRT